MSETWLTGLVCIDGKRNAALMAALRSWGVQFVFRRTH